MAKINYYNALSLELFSDIFDGGSLRLEHEGKHRMIYRDDEGATVDIRGFGFKYDGGDVTAGTVLSAVMRDADGHRLMSVENPRDASDANVLEASFIYNDIKQSGPLSLHWAFHGGDDRLIGSKRADKIDGDTGNDVLKGRAGKDFLTGNDGTDRLTGGSGADSFIFRDGYGKDTITDFDQNGDDVIWTTHDLYSRLEKHQHGDTLILDFGFGDQLILEHTHKQDITADDFRFFPDSSF
jgi:Ca2+-binding RTX toxin-like protein